MFMSVFLMAVFLMLVTFAVRIDASIDSRRMWSIVLIGCYSDSYQQGSLSSILACLSNH